MQIVTGYEGTPHVTSWQDRDLNQGIFGADTYILNVGSKMAASIISSNEIHIADGAVMMQGCLGVIQKGTYDTIAIDNGSQGMQRRDLICAQYSKDGSGVESLSLVVVKGTPAASNPSDPAVTSGDIQNGDSLVQVPIYRVSISGITISSVTRLVDDAGNISEGGGGATTIVRSGTATLPAQSGAGSNVTTVYSELLPAGVYIIAFTLSTDEDDLVSMGVLIDANGQTFRSNSAYNPSQYNSRIGVTGFLHLSSATTVVCRAYQNTVSGSVSVPYKVVYKKVG